MGDDDLVDVHAVILAVFLAVRLAGPVMPTMGRGMARRRRGSSQCDAQQEP